MTKQNKTKPADREDIHNTVRLQKLLAAHGHGSRRACEEFILEGRVEIDGEVVNKLGTKVDPDKQKITLDGERIIQQRLQYFVLNKPAGVVSTSSDPTGRVRVIDLIKSKSRVYNVGRLDKSSEGLIMVTNDGDLAHKLTHPSFGVEKKYNVLVAGVPGREQLQTLKKGVYLAEAFVQVSNVRVKKKMRDKTLLEIVLDEGRNREIRRLLAKIGHKVIQLKRIAIGPLTLGELPTGSHRQLTHTEIRGLKRFVAKLKPSKSKPKRTRKSRAQTSRFTKSKKAASFRTTKKKRASKKGSKVNSKRSSR